MNGTNIASIAGFAVLMLGACDAPAPPDTDSGPAAEIDAGGDPCGPLGGAGDGAPCQCDSDCTTGAICRVEDVQDDPHGSCLRLCSDPGVTCSPGAECVPMHGDVCCPTCTTTADCPSPGRVCDSNGYCAARCSADSDCRNGRCEPYTGRCDTTPATGLGIWADCTMSGECRSNFCGAAGCVTLCVLSRDNCPDGSICIGSGDTDSGLCADPCADASSCQPGESCAGVPAPAGSTVCLPDELLE